MEFSEIEIVSWSNIATGAGAVILTVAFTELSKNVESLAKMPTQLVSYFIAAIIMTLGTIFTSDDVTASNVILALLNSAIISFGANGAYIAYKRITTNTKTGGGVKK